MNDLQPIPSAIPEAYSSRRDANELVQVSRFVRDTTQDLLSFHDAKIGVNDETLRFLRGSRTINDIDEFKRDLFEVGRLFDVQRFILYCKKNEKQAEVLMIFSQGDDPEKVGDIVSLEGNPNLQAAFENKNFSQIPVPGVGIDAAFPVGHNNLVFGIDNTHAARKFTPEELILLKFVAFSTVNAYNAGHSTHLLGVDPLTKLGNRRVFDLAIDQGIDIFEQPRASVGTIAFFDIDHFRNFNNTYGHAAGDAVLRHVTSVLKNEGERLGGDIFRYGGEECVGIFPGELSYEEVDSMRKAVEKSVCEFDGISHSVTTSVGFCCKKDIPPLTQKDQGDFINEHFPEQIPVKRMVRLADQAVYKSKDSGRNCTTQWGV